MKRFHVAVAITASLVATGLLLTSCGSSKQTTVVNRLVSPAQEEADMKRALDAGAISQAEYQQQIAKIRAAN